MRHLARATLSSARGVIAAFTLLGACTTCGAAAAAELCTDARHSEVRDVGRDAALIIDGKSGQVLYERNAGAERHPASLTKMMTLYLLFDA